MIFIFFLFIESKQGDKNGDLYILFARPERNPLEMYPPTKLPLCIHNSMPNSDLVVCSKCKRKINHVTRESSESFQPWCSCEISNENYTLLSDQLKENYSVCFGSGKRNICIPIGQKNGMIFTQYHFYFSEKNGLFSLFNVTQSNIVNVTAGIRLNFTYQIIFTDSKNFAPSVEDLDKGLNKKSKLNRPLLYFLIFCVLILAVSGFFVLRPDFLSNDTMNAIATVPSNNFLIVTLSGAGAGVYGYVATLLIVYLVRSSFESITVTFIVPAITSAILTGIATSLICTICRLKDVASALYFAPLISPSIVLFIIFSIQWIPVCFGSCLTIPMKKVFVYVVTVVFVKLPVNLITGLVAGAVFTPPPYHTIRLIKTRKFTSSRPFFLSVSTIFLFIIAFPLFDSLMDKPDHIPFEIDKGDVKLIFIYIPIWIAASTLVGISSLTMADPFNWATLAFVSAFGAGIVLWIVSFFKATLAYGMTGSLQISLHMAILSLMCIGLSMSAAGVSVIASALWIALTGIPSKDS